MSTKSIILIITIIVFLGAGVGALFGFLARDRGEPSFSSEVARTTTGSQWEKNVVEGKLVEGFPPFPVYPKAEIDYSYIQRSGVKRSYEGVFETPDSLPDVVKFYIEAMPRAGWTIEPMDEEKNIYTSGSLGYHIRNEKHRGALFIEMSEEKEGTTEIAAEFVLQ